jgi:hypothetical protein
MSVLHVIAQLPNGQQKSLFNRTQEQALEIVSEFVRESTLTTRWGNETQTRQAYELRVYETDQRYNKRKDGAFADYVKRKRNIYPRFEKEVTSRQRKPVTRVFVVMPIQGERYGSQSDQTIFREFNERFDVIEQTLLEFDCVAIRIDKEAPLGGLVERIKREIARARFVVADLTDERPSCYFEVGYAEALRKPLVFLASKESVMRPGVQTHIHFDIHQNVQFFTNHEEMAEKLHEVVNRNKDRLLATEDSNLAALTALLPSLGSVKFAPPRLSELDVIPSPREDVS